MISIKKSVILFFAGLTIILPILSCVQQQAQPISIITETSQRSQTPQLAITSSQTPAVFPSATLTEKPFVNYPTHFNFPSWMGNSQTMILTNPITETKGNEITSANIMFLNALTGERYNIPFPSNANAYFWYDNMHFGFLSDDFQVMHFLDLGNGQVTEENTTIESTRLLSINDSFVPLVIRQDPLSPSSFMFDYALSYWGSPYSLDTRYFAESDNSINEGPVTVTDLETGQIIWKSSPPDGYSDVHFLWSPANSSYLAIVRGGYSITESEFPVNNTTLIVVDVKTSRMISSTKVDAGRIRWSPDGTKILYRNAISDYWNFGYSFTEAPCFFNLENQKESCIWRIPNRHLKNGQTLITTDDYQWSADGKSINFTYSYDSPNGMGADICNYNLVDGSFTCPTYNLPELSGWNMDWRNGWSITTYNLSLDGKHVYFCLDSNHPLSDDRGGLSQDGLIEINGTKLITWVSRQETSTNYSITRCSFYNNLWRPLP